MNRAHKSVHLLLWTVFFASLAQQYLDTRSMTTLSEPESLPLIDISPLLNDNLTSDSVIATAKALDKACRRHGFFRISGHGLSGKRDAMEDSAREFFALPDDTKRRVEMSRAGRAWRGWFPVGGELTSGQADGKEGLYVGLDHDDDHPRVKSHTPLHGHNLFPEAPASLETSVNDWLAEMVPLAHAVMRGLAIGLGLTPHWFEEHLTTDPTVLFRIFHYPSSGDFAFGVGEHTDYGILTLLAQDDVGGLQVKSAGTWIDVPADPSIIVCNIGDMLERLTEGRYKSTPHRVKGSNNRTRGRLSFPFFFDPSWDATVTALPLDDSPPAVDLNDRWDGENVHAWEGSYGDYLSAKVSKCFPALFEEAIVETS